MSLFLKALLLLAQNFLAYRRLKKAESSTGLPPESEGPAGSPPLPQSSKLEGILPTGTVSDTQTASLPRSKAMPMVFQTNRNSETLPPAESANRCNSDKESDSRWEIIPPQEPRMRSAVLQFADKVTGRSREAPGRCCPRGVLRST